CMATATTLEEALTIEEAGIDLVIASGVEAGGHRASFMRPAEESLTKTPFLVSQIADNISIPVVAAGGISNGKDIKKVLTLGAAAAQLGTAFLATNESDASAAHKSKLLSAEPIKTNLTKVLREDWQEQFRIAFPWILISKQNLLLPPTPSRVVF